MARCVSETVTATDQSTFLRRRKRRGSAAGLRGGHVVEQPDLALAAPGDREEALGPLHGLLPRLHLEEGEAADELLRLGEGAVGHGELPLFEPDAHALGA